MVHTAQGKGEGGTGLTSWSSCPMVSPISCAHIALTETNHKGMNNIKVGGHLQICQVGESKGMKVLDK